MLHERPRPFQQLEILRKPNRGHSEFQKENQTRTLSFGAWRPGVLYPSTSHPLPRTPHYPHPHASLLRRMAESVFIWLPDICLVQ